MDYAKLIQSQRDHFQSGATRSAEWRKSMLGRLRAALSRSEDVILDALHADLRKSRHEACLSETGLVISEIDHALKHLKSWMRPQKHAVPFIAWPGKAHVNPEPRGVALILSPWNYPVQLLLSPLVSALAAGNCAVLKPSELAPHTASVLVQLIGSIFSDHEVAICPGGKEVAEGLLEQRFDHIFYTGSSSVGRLVMSAAARHLTPVTLELGGKCPCIVTEGAALEVAARRIAWGRFTNAGQTCVAPDYVLVDKKVKSQLLEKLGNAVSTMYGANPKASADYGRIINRRHWERLFALLGSGRVVCGGDADVDDLYIAPTVLDEVAIDSPLMQEEIFGPILPVLAYDTPEEAVAFVQQRPSPLAIYVFSNDKRLQATIAAQTQSGGVCINDTVVQVACGNLPFGGVGSSGMGASHGKAGFDEFSHRRSILWRSVQVDPSMRYPPARGSLLLLKRIRRFLLGV
ncbi:MAG: aldehyde dehydrogenase family protein [Verrucomicrobiaceae bacterium]|nr:aldehyde dehydrogenase family protein [Verrucomicrobiaceae bacterium]